MIQISLDDIKKMLAPTSPTHGFEIGKSYFIRSITMHYTGRVTHVTDSDVWLEDAAWIADSGRFYDALAHGTLNEVEPYPHGVAVSRSAIVDFAPWHHDLPRDQK